MRRPHWNTTCPKRLSRSRLSRLLAVGIVILTGLGGGAWSLGAESRRATANWPAWRRDGSGISDEKGLPTVWSETQNVLWRTALPGEGNSSPIVWGNQVFLTAALEQGAKRLVLCYAADSGKPLWTRELLPGLKTTYYPKTGFINDRSPGPYSDQWVSEGGDKVIQFPIKVRAITVGINCHKRDLLDFKKSAPALRISAVGATGTGLSRGASEVK